MATSSTTRRAHPPRGEVLLVAALVEACATCAATDRPGAPGASRPGVVVPDTNGTGTGRT